LTCAWLKRNFDYDSPVFTQKNISINRHNKSTKKPNSQTELSKLIADQAASCRISQEQAIENLSLLCNSISVPYSTISQTSQQDFTSSTLTTTYNSPDTVFGDICVLTLKNITGCFGKVSCPYGGTVALNSVYTDQARTAG
jgi:hypothetical protein